MKKYKLVQEKNVQHHNTKVNEVLEELDKDNAVVLIEIRETTITENTFSTVITWTQLW